MITSIWQVGEPGAENEAELKKYCAKSRDMVEEAVRVFERVSLNHAWYNRLFGKQAGDRGTARCHGLYHAGLCKRRTCARYTGEKSDL